MLLLNQESLNPAQASLLLARELQWEFTMVMEAWQRQCEPGSRKKTFDHESNVSFVFKIRATSELVMRFSGQSQMYKMKKQSLCRRLLLSELGKILANYLYGIRALGFNILHLS